MKSLMKFLKNNDSNSKIQLLSCFLPILFNLLFIETNVDISENLVLTIIKLFKACSEELFSSEEC